MAEEKKTNSAPAKAVTAVKKDETAKLSFWQKVCKWFREMKSELKKVIWPTGKQLTNNVLISLGMMIASAIIIWGFDEIAQMLVRLLITLAG